jgi:hypothetical protein
MDAVEEKIVTDLINQGIRVLKVKDPQVKVIACEAFEEQLNAARRDFPNSSMLQRKWLFIFNGVCPRCGKSVE